MSQQYPSVLLEKAVSEFSKLPGVGRKTAMRLVLHLLRQEASAVGQAYLLGVDDYIFGSHRSHGEILAKGMSAINKLSDSDLYDYMKNFMGGRILKIVEKDQKSTKELAIDFLVYGALAEIFAREKKSEIVYAPEMPSSPQFVLNIEKARKELKDK